MMALIHASGGEQKMGLQTLLENRKMKWETPQATEFRFGMEITMYVANR